MNSSLKPAVAFANSQVQSPASKTAGNPCDNHLLASLLEADLQHWLPQLDEVTLQLGQVLSESGSTPQHVYFPTTAIVSLLYTTQDGDSSEIAVIGHDGVVGLSSFMGGNATPSQAVVQSPGQAFRLPARCLQEAGGVAPSVLTMMLRYTRLMLAQVAQTAACNRYHSIDQLLCRRLLMGLDRTVGASLVMTQELAANLLGVRREGVTAAALKLQQAGVIRYSRGHIAVLDRQRLEERTQGHSNHAPGHAAPAHAAHAAHALQAWPCAA